MVVAIDGPAGVGKSSLARRISDGYGFFNLNSGAFYRAVALKTLEEGIDAGDAPAVIRISKTVELDIVGGRLLMDGVPIESRLRTDEIDQASSRISTIREVRHQVNRNLRRVAGHMNLVAEGRDMTTVVFPDAEVKVYLDADPAVRALRRFSQGTSDMTLGEIEAAIRERDERDRNKVEGSLRIADDAVVLNTSTLTLDEVYEKVSRLIKTYL